MRGTTIDIICVDDDIDKALSLLARRISPELEYFSSMHWIDIISEQNEFIVVCRICKEKIGKLMDVDCSIHGMEHLKEFNLLSFI